MPRNNKKSTTDVRGLVIAITGAARGIGFETAKTLQDRGATVVIGDIDSDAVGKATAELGHDGFEVDVTDPTSFEKFLDEVEASAGPIDVLINNAGIMPTGPLLNYDINVVRRNFDIDLLGVVIGTQLAAKRMVARGGGQVINIGSIAGRLAVPGLTIYNGAKAGVIAFSEAADAELADSGVRVKTVNPTFTQTGLISGIKTNKFTQTVTPAQVAAQVLASIEGDKMHATVPKSVSWVHATGIMPRSMKRASLRMTGMDKLFMSYDATARAEYLERVNGNPTPSGKL
ncbi:SDR family oxidoreductase [Williamsia phyllosphaerae]|uniref:Short chain dehydrogenase/reductase n=1 Tax=Williamsia phyllosphaerae TaxID=885042 RepID=A0ABQ1UQ23_9NOCA|nr:SDR family oxidoreductase [Williamsia phyllosphaerae]GGF24399.1 putative short chain dehydrogenase/reductase [Williamsia phyllosphaerae]